MFIQKGELIKAVKEAKAFTTKKGNLTILANVVINAPEKTIRSTDLEAYFSKPLEIVPGEVPGKKPFESNLPEKSELEELKIDQLKNIAGGVDLTGLTKKDDIVFAIFEAWEGEIDAEIKAMEPPAEIFCISADAFMKILKADDTEDSQMIEIIVNHEDRSVNIGEKFKNILTSAPEDFPDAPEIGSPVEICSVSGSTLKKTRLIIPSDEKRAHMICSCFDCAKNTLVSTNGKMLIAVDVPMESEAKLLIGSVTLGKIATLSLKENIVVAGHSRTSDVKKDEAELPLEASAVETYFNYVSFTAGTSEIITAPHDGEFPDYEGILKPGEHILTIGSEKLKKLIAQSSVLTDDTYNGAIFNFNGGLKVDMHHPLKGRFNTPVEIPYVKGKILDPIEIGLNPENLAIALNGVDGDKFEISLTDNKHPVVFSSENYKAFVMPMKL